MVAFGTESMEYIANFWYSQSGNSGLFGTMSSPSKGLKQGSTDAHIPPKQKVARKTSNRSPCQNSKASSIAPKTTIGSANTTTMAKMCLLKWLEAIEEAYFGEPGTGLGVTRVEALEKELQGTVSSGSPRFSDHVQKLGELIWVKNDLY